MYTLRQLRYFVAAAEAGSVSRAAQALSISQSAVTEAVRELEADLGVALLDRHARGVSVTERGHLFLRQARAILEAVAASRADLGPAREALAGTLALGVTSLMAGYVMSDLLRRFRRANYRPWSLEGDRIESRDVSGMLPVVQVGIA